jgi:hypothetical protein
MTEDVKKKLGQCDVHKINLLVILSWHLWPLVCRVCSLVMNKCPILFWMHGQNVALQWLTSLLHMWDVLGHNFYICQRGVMKSMINLLEWLVVRSICVCYHWCDFPCSLFLSTGVCICPFPPMRCETYLTNQSLGHYLGPVLIWDQSKELWLIL